MSRKNPTSIDLSKLEGIIDRINPQETTITLEELNILYWDQVLNKDGFEPTSEYNPNAIHASVVAVNHYNMKTKISSTDSHVEILNSNFNFDLTTKENGNGIIKKFFHEKVAMDEQAFVEKIKEHHTNHSFVFRPLSIVDKTLSDFLNKHGFKIQKTLNQLTLLQTLGFFYSTRFVVSL